MSEGGVNPDPAYTGPSDAVIKYIQGQNEDQENVEKAGRDGVSGEVAEETGEIGIKKTQKRESAEKARKVASSDVQAKDEIAKAKEPETVTKSEAAAKLDPGKPLLDPAELSQVISQITHQDINTQLVQMLKSMALSAVVDQETEEKSKELDYYGFLGDLRTQDTQATSEIARNKLEEWREQIEEYEAALKKQETGLAVSLGLAAIVAAPMIIPAVIVGTGGLREGGAVEQMGNMVGIEPEKARKAFAITIMVVMMTGGFAPNYGSMTSITGMARMAAQLGSKGMFFAELWALATDPDEDKWKEASLGLDSNSQKAAATALEERLREVLNEEEAERVAAFLQLLAVLMAVLGMMGSQMGESGQLPAGLLEEGGEIPPEFADDFIEKAFAEMAAQGFPIDEEQLPEFRDVVRENLGDLTRGGMEQVKEVDYRMEQSMRAEQSLAQIDQQGGDALQYQPVGA